LQSKWGWLPSGCEDGAEGHFSRWRFSHRAISASRFTGMIERRPASPQASQTALARGVHGPVPGQACHEIFCADQRRAGLDHVGAERTSGHGDFLTVFSRPLMSVISPSRSWTV
jgi:hypothetical protein